MSVDVIRALISKELLLFSRNRLFAFVAVLGLVTYSLVYFLMPSAIDGEMRVGLYAPGLSDQVMESLRSEGIPIASVHDSESGLSTAVLSGQVGAGLIVPPAFSEQLATGVRPTVSVVLRRDTEKGNVDAFMSLIRSSLERLPVPHLQDSSTKFRLAEEVLGSDTLGDPIALRDRMLPLFVVLILLTETMALSSLIAEETENRTIGALLVTPVTVPDLFAAKGISGVSMAFVQAMLLMLITGGLESNPALMALALLIGSLLITGTAFLIASVASDLLSVLGLGTLSLLIFTVPSFSVLIPGAVGDLVKVIPSYYLVDTVNKVANLGASLSDVYANLIVLLVTSVAFLWLGTVLLGRRIA